MNFSSMYNTSSRDTSSNSYVHPGVPGNLFRLKTASCGAIRGKRQISLIPFLTLPPSFPRYHHHGYQSLGNLNFLLSSGYERSLQQYYHVFFSILSLSVIFSSFAGSANLRGQHKVEETGPTLPPKPFPLLHVSLIKLCNHNLQLTHSDSTFND